MGLVAKFKAGWAAPPGAWQQKPPPPAWQQPPAAPPGAPPPWPDELPPYDAAAAPSDPDDPREVIAGLLAENERLEAELERRRTFAAEQVTARQAAEAALAEAAERIAKLEAATTSLVAGLDQAQERLAAAEADRDRYAGDLAAGMTPGLCRRFLRAALVVLHPDKYRGASPVADVADFVEARYRELEDEVAKIAGGK
jgi:hypothetical protein